MSIEICPQCAGYGNSSEIELACCGRYLDTGECCAAIHGNANLVPIQVACPLCGGSGEVEYHGD